MTPIERLIRRLIYRVGQALTLAASPSRPRRFKMFVSGQEKTPMGLKFAVSVSLPTLPADDEIKDRKLTVAVNGGDAVAVPVTLADTVVALADKYELGATLVARLSHVDEAGNEGPAREVTFVVTDTFAPAIPGEFGLTVTGQEFTPDAPPEG